MSQQASFRFTSSFDGSSTRGALRPFKAQLLKWVGNKQRFAYEIALNFPRPFGRYIEPFLGSAGVLGTVAPKRGLAGDALKPLAQLWATVGSEPRRVKRWYKSRFDLMEKIGKKETYERVRKSYNDSPNPADLLFLSRACYGGVMRFRKDGYISTPCGAHALMSAETFSRRVEVWHERLAGSEIRHADFEETIEEAKRGDVVYCDPPYMHTQRILYGSQAFSFDRLFNAIERAKRKGAFVALSIDGTKKSGAVLCDVTIPKSLFAREVRVNCGRSMLRRFQMSGRSLETEHVTDRLLLTS